MWRLPVIDARDREDSPRILRFLAQLYVLQGLPGVGPALASRVLLQFGSVERVVTAGPSMLMRLLFTSRD
jgi:hypothetical protein